MGNEASSSALARAESEVDDPVAAGAAATSATGVAAAAGTARGAAAMPAAPPALARAMSDKDGDTSGENSLGGAADNVAAAGAGAAVGAAAGASGSTPDHAQRQDATNHAASAGGLYRSIGGIPGVYSPLMILSPLTAAAMLTGTTHRVAAHATGSNSPALTAVAGPQSSGLSATAVAAATGLAAAPETPLADGSRLQPPSPSPAATSGVISSALFPQPSDPGFVTFAASAPSEPGSPFGGVPGNPSAAVPPSHRSVTVGVAPRGLAAAVTVAADPGSGDDVLHPAPAATDAGSASAQRGGTLLRTAAGAGSSAAAGAAVRADAGPTSSRQGQAATAQGGADATALQVHDDEPLKAAIATICTSPATDVVKDHPERLADACATLCARLDRRSGDARGTQALLVHFRESGLLPATTQTLRKASDNTHVTWHLCNLLDHLTATNDEGRTNLQCLADAGLLVALPDFMSSHASNGPITAAASSVLAKLALVSKTRCKELRDAGAIQAVATTLQRQTESRAAIASLCNVIARMTLDDSADIFKENARMFIEAGVFSGFAAVLRRYPEELTVVKAVAVPLVKVITRVDVGGLVRLLLVSSIDPRLD